MQRSLRTLLLGASAIAAATAFVPGASATVFRDNVGDEGAQEFAAGWDGVVQIFLWNTATGSVNFNCTGAMINHRTVLSAAHCFDNQPGSAYGFAGGIVPLIAYGENTFDALFPWLFDGLPAQQGPDFGLTFGTDLIMHPQIDPETAGEFGFPGFPAGDFALIATLDPLDMIPSYAMLFSPLTGEQIAEGVHTVTVGYGSFGPASTGTIGINGLRRAGENMLGFMGSQNDFFAALAQDPAARSSRPDGLANRSDQVMYWTDMDLPDRTGECERDTESVIFGFTNTILCTDSTFFDGVALTGDSLILPGQSIDYFPGDALPFEATTAGGDSGGPLFFDELGDQPLIGGVLSGGFREGFFHPTGTEYASVSYWNALFTVADWLAANNPYVYAAAQAGDGNWSDADHWVQSLDPNYIIINEAGELVNGLPNPGQGDAAFFDIEPEGTVFDSDPAEYPAPPPPPPAAADAAANDAASGLVAGPDGAIANDAASGLVGAAGSFEASGLVGVKAEDEGANDRRVGPELLNGPDQPDAIAPTPIGGAGNLATGPGSTGFIPNNNDGIDGTRARFFEVSLSQAGTTTVDMDVEIDRLTIANLDARLDVGADWAFETILDTQINFGELHVDGLFGAREIINSAGLISGEGILGAQTIFNLLGTISPGEAGGVGELEFITDLVLTSGSMFWVDIGPDGNDMLRVSGDREVIPGEGLTPFGVSGDVSLDGMLALNYIDGALPRFGDQVTFLSADGEIIGGFSQVADLPGVLFATPSINADGTVSVTIQATSFTAELPDDLTANQAALANLLDSSRGAAGLSDLFGQVDLLSGEDLQLTFDLLSPTSGFSGALFALNGGTHFGDQVFNRGQQLRAGASGFAHMASNTDNVRIAAADPMTAFFAAAGATAADPNAPTTAFIGNGTGAYAQIGFEQGEVGQTSSLLDEEYEGERLTVGVDRAVGDGAILGATLSVMNADGDFVYAPASSIPGLAPIAAGALGMAGAEVSGFTGALYVSTSNGLVDFDAYVGGGTRDIEATRFTPIAGGQNPQAQMDAREFVMGARVSRDLALGPNALFTPSSGLRYALLDVDAYEETGGSSALAIQGRQLKSILTDIGGDLRLKTQLAGLTLEPTFGGALVYDLDGSRDRVSGSFVADRSNTVEFVGPERDKLWYEAQAGVALRFNARTSAHVAVNQSIERDDLDFTSAQVGVNVRW